MEAGSLPLTETDPTARDFRLDGRVAVITGAGSGIGRAIAVRFAAHGAAIRVLELNEAAAAATCQQIVAAGGDASAAVPHMRNDRMHTVVITLHVDPNETVEVLFAGTFHCADMRDAGVVHKNMKAFTARK